MKLTKNINGQEVQIELTPEEIHTIYQKCRDKYTTEDLCSRYNIPENKIYEAVDRFENALNCNDSFWDLYWMTVEDICNEMGFEESDGE